MRQRKQIGLVLRAGRGVGQGRGALKCKRRRAVRWRGRQRVSVRGRRGKGVERVRGRSRRIGDRVARVAREIGEIHMVRIRCSLWVEQIGLSSDMGGRRSDHARRLRRHGLRRADSRTSHDIRVRRGRVNRFLVIVVVRSASELGIGPFIIPLLVRVLIGDPRHQLVLICEIARVVGGYTVFVDAFADCIANQVHTGDHVGLPVIKNCRFHL